MKYTSVFALSIGFLQILTCADCQEHKREIDALRDAETTAQTILNVPDHNKLLAALEYEERVIAKCEKISQKFQESKKLPSQKIKLNKTVLTARNILEILAQKHANFLQFLEHLSECSLEFEKGQPENHTMYRFKVLAETYQQQSAAKKWLKSQLSNADSLVHIYTMAKDYSDLLPKPRKLIYLQLQEESAKQAAAVTFPTLGDWHDLKTKIDSELAKINSQKRKNIR